MVKKNDEFLTNNLFSFENAGCDYKKTVIETSNGSSDTVEFGLKLNTQKNRFAFATGGVGLVTVGDRGRIISKNLLGNVISIKYGDTSKLLKFFSDFGFFFELTDSEDYMEINTVDIFSMIERLRATVELLNQLGELKQERKDYSKILNLVTYLLFSPPTELNFIGYSTCIHPFEDELENSYGLYNNLRNEPGSNFSGIFSVSDSVCGSYSFEEERYLNIVNGFSRVHGEEDIFFKKIVHYYVNRPDAETKNRMIVDFLFHYEMEVGIIRDFRYYGELNHYNPPCLENFSSKLKKSLLEVAKIVIAEEINWNIRNVHPEYNTEKMAPSWKIDSLMSALYFSLFYMKPGQELYKPCENPNCENYFLVKSTATNKKYCSQTCSNAVQQARSRKRKKEQALN